MPNFAQPALFIFIAGGSTAPEYLILFSLVTIVWKKYLSKTYRDAPSIPHSQHDLIAPQWIQDRCWQGIESVRWSILWFYIQWDDNSVNLGIGYVTIKWRNISRWCPSLLYFGGLRKGQLYLALELFTNPCELQLAHVQPYYYSIQYLVINRVINTLPFSNWRQRWCRRSSVSCNSQSYDYCAIVQWKAWTRRKTAVVQS